MEFDNRQPIYLQIIDKIKKDIILGKIGKGEKLPSGKTMAIELKVNVNTVQRVYQELEKEDVIYTLRGKGSFITENEEVVMRIKKEMADEMLETFVEGMTELGFDKESMIKCLKDYMKGDKNEFAKS